MIRKSIYLVLIINFNSIFHLAYSLRNCNDCVPIKQCQPAIVLALYHKNDDSIKKFRAAHCGTQNEDIMVCCNDFSLLPRNDEPSKSEDEEIENHPNLRLLPQECGGLNGDRIIGGSIAALGEFPWMTLISYETRDGYQFQCGGSLINSRYILTAAHCIKPNIVGIRLGEHDTEKKVDCEGEGELLVCQDHVQDIGVAEKIAHEQYSQRPYFDNDIALLRLAQPANLSHVNVGPICLPISSNLRNNDLGGKQATVAGWGKTEALDRLSPVLRKVKIPMGTFSECVTHQGKGVMDRMKGKLCGGEADKDSCVRDSGGPLFIENTPSITTGPNRRAGAGDSGGPLMLEAPYNGVKSNILYGIVSYGRRDCGTGIYPGVYTDVTKFMKWILDHIKE